MNDLKHRNESIAQLAEFHKGRNAFYQTNNGKIYIEKRIQEHKASIKDKQAKLDRLKTLLKLLGKRQLLSHIYQLHASKTHFRPRQARRRRNKSFKRATLLHKAAANQAEN
jgi:hypothetical protein